MNDVVAIIKGNFLDKLSQIKNSEALLKLKVEFLGKKGVLAEEMKKLNSMTLDEKKVFGAAINSVRDIVISELTNYQRILTAQDIEEKLNKEYLDISIPGRFHEKGKIHPITHVINEVTNIFSMMGFISVDGPDIEDDWHNFTGLNIHQLHPARQMHDTFYINKDKNDSDLLLRTHTSTVQMRYMANHKPPVKIISVGRVFRSDFDATHTPMFHQIEGLCVSETITFSHLKWCVTEFLRAYFGLKSVPMRFRSSYFPFTEPSLEIDIMCDRKKDKNTITVGEGSDWMEIMGCGMLHTKVLSNMGIDPLKYQGFAFGIGIERLAMLKYNISDLRHFFEGDMRWLSRHGF